MPGLALCAGLVSGLLVIAPACAQDGSVAQNPVARGVVCLTANEPTDDVASAAPTLLVRELARQAVLLSAREEMGLGTRDMVLREPFPDEPAASVKIVEIDTAHSSGAFVRVQLRLRGATDRLFEKELSLTATEPHDNNYLELLESLEPLTRGEFVESLKKAGFEKTGKTGAAFSPDVTEPLLNELNLWSQMAAVRQLHAMADDEEAASARLGGIVRAYANLGLMSEYHWSATHKVFKARALLYAQRMVARTPQAPDGYWHRAYALTFSGLHRLALADLERAKTLAQEAQLTSPEWVDLLRYTCLYQTEPLKAAAQESTSQRQLAALLAYITFESAPARPLKLKLGHAMLEQSPECLRLIESMAGEMEVVNLHFLTVEGPRILASSLPKRLKAVPGLPDEVGKYVDEMKDAAADVGDRLVSGADIAVFVETNPGLWERLRVAGAADQDVGEPSLAALGSMVEDVTFSLLSRRNYFMQKMWGVPVDDFIHHVKPIVGEHRYFAMIESLSSEALRDKQKFEDLVRDLNIVDAETQEWAMMGLALPVPPPDKVQGAKARSLAVAHTDPTAYELEHLIGKGIEQKRHKEFGHALLEASPHSPVAMAILIQSDWEFAEPHVAAWSAEHVDHPSLLGALAWQYIQLEKTTEAKELLEKHARLTGDTWPYLTLAGVYRKEGDDPKWQATLEEYLEKVEYSLEHVGVQVDLANYFMKQSQWEKAKPYAEAAAQSGAFNGMSCAARVYEGLGQMDKAEEMVSAAAERYPQALTYRYYWCKRTGRGDEAGALKAAQDYLEGFGERLSPIQLTSLGTIGLLSGQRELSRASFIKGAGQNVVPFQLLNLALLYEEDGNAAARDQWIGKLLDQVPKSSESVQNANMGSITAAKLFQTALSRDSKAALVPKEVFGAAQAIKLQREWVNYYYYVGRFDEIHGHPSQSRHWYRFAMRTNDVDNESYLLSAVRLRALDAAGVPDEPLDLQYPDVGTAPPRAATSSRISTTYMAAGAIALAVLAGGLAVWLRRRQRSGGV